MPELLFRRAWDAAALVAAHPPRFTNENKRVVDAIASPPGSAHRGTIEVTRWRAAALPEHVGEATELTERAGYFAYEAPAAGTIAWWQNFADPVVFGFYAGGLFAQDEMQVSEHPALASVRSALVAEGHGWTVGRGPSGEEGPTPVLVAGVERRCAVDTEPSLERGRIQGLYGNRFAAADPAVIRAATQRIEPPTVSNIVAIAAPHPASGRYTEAQVRGVLVTAYSGYAAVAAESERLAPGARVALHTGFWGCGAFGGNRVLMTVLQGLAARLAGVDLVMHVGDSAGRRDVAEARVLLAEIGAGERVEVVIERLVARGFQWGVSDGN